jgi:hypothetical protein
MFFIDPWFQMKWCSRCRRAGYLELGSAQVVLWRHLCRRLQACWCL